MTPRTPLARSLIEARARTDTLFGLVKPDAFYERPIPERHRIIFYLGHLDAFDWNQIGQWALGMKPLHASFEQMFAFGIDPPVGREPDDKPSDWPTLDEVRGYTQQVRQTLDDVLDRAPEQILYVAVEHRLMHAETFAYILHRARRSMVLARDGGHHPAAPRLAGVRDVRAGEGLCAVGGQDLADGGPVPSRGLRHADRRRAVVSVGQRAARRAARQLRLPTL